MFFYITAVMNGSYPPPLVFEFKIAPAAGAFQSSYPVDFIISQALLIAYSQMRNKRQRRHST